MDSYLIKGLEIGIIFGIPIGIIGVLALQRTILNGYLFGFVTGLGSSVADLIYASIGALGLTIISDFLIRNQNYINIIGGAIIFIIGIKLIMKKELNYSESSEGVTFTKSFLSSFVISITNPATILSFIFVFSYWGIPSNLYIVDAVLLIIGIFVGTCIWWFVLAIIGTFFKERINYNNIIKLNKAFGIIIIFFSLLVFKRVIN